MHQAKHIERHISVHSKPLWGTHKQNRRPLDTQKSKNCLRLNPTPHPLKLFDQLQRHGYGIALTIVLIYLNVFMSEIGGSFEALWFKGNGN